MDVHAGKQGDGREEMTMKCPLKPRIVKYEHGPDGGVTYMRCKDYSSKDQDLTGCGALIRLPRDWKIGDSFKCAICGQTIQAKLHNYSEAYLSYFLHRPGPLTWAQEWGECDGDECPMWKENRCGIPPENIRIEIPINMNIKEGDTQTISMRASLI
jgi:hypothetical protein